MKHVEKVSAMEISFHPSQIFDKRYVVKVHHLEYLKETICEKQGQYNKLRVLMFKRRIHATAKWNEKDTSMEEKQVIRLVVQQKDHFLSLPVCLVKGNA